MNSQDRAEFFKKFLDTYVFKVSDSKGKEYSRGEEDVNSNFKRVAADLGISPEQALWVYVRKHLDSVAYAVKIGQYDGLSEPIEGRIGDIVVYMLILGSLIEEQRRQPDIKKTASEMIRENTGLGSVTWDWSFTYDNHSLNFPPYNIGDYTIVPDEKYPGSGWVLMWDGRMWKKVSD